MIAAVAGSSSRARRSAPAPGGAELRRPGFVLGRGQRVGLYGGSFDPVHPGHLHVARTAARRLRLDRLIWLVTARNPLKAAPPGESVVGRLATIHRAAGGPGVIVTGLEARIGAGYTVQTVRALQARFPTTRFVWIMGADGLTGFHRWRDWTAIARLAPIAVVARPGHAFKSRFSNFVQRFAPARLPASAAATLATRRPPAWVYLTAPLHHASSTRLRESAGGARDRGPAGSPPNFPETASDTA
ncbi:MAG: nicotinate-nucleotide adenylyltransferase [Caulobacteraceae bacterium]